MIKVKVGNDLLGTCSALSFDQNINNLKLVNFDSDFLRSCEMELNSLIGLRELAYQFECLTGYKLDGDLLEKLASGEIRLQ